jgi:hypothetical protein
LQSPLLRLPWSRDHLTKRAELGTLFSGGAAEELETASRLLAESGVPRGSWLAARSLGGSHRQLRERVWGTWGRLTLRRRLAALRRET